MVPAHVDGVRIASHCSLVRDRSDFEYILGMVVGNADLRTSTATWLAAPSLPQPARLSHAGHTVAESSKATMIRYNCNENWTADTVKHSPSGSGENSSREEVWEGGKRADTTVGSSLSCRPRPSKREQTALAHRQSSQRTRSG